MRVSVSGPRELGYANYRVGPGLVMIKFKVSEKKNLPSSVSEAAIINSRREELIKDEKIETTFNYS